MEKKGPATEECAAAQCKSMKKECPAPEECAAAQYKGLEKKCPATEERAAVHYKSLEKEWPPVEECAQYTYGMLHCFLKPLDLESFDELDDSYYYNSDSDDDEFRAKDTHQTVLRFLRQVRESRGYDVDCIPPACLNSTFRPVYMEIELRSVAYKKEVMEATQFAIDTINDETKAQTGRTYKLKELLKVVDTRNMMFLLTFTVTAEDRPDMEADEKTIQAMVFHSEVCKRSNFVLEDWRVKPVSA